MRKSYIQIKNKILLLLLLASPIVTAAQEQTDLFILNTDTTWDKEMFHFPLGFAPDIAYQGIEDARFPVGWSKKDSSTFWSYVFAWHIEGTTLITEKDLESNLQIYFDGLMNAVNRDTSIEVPGTTALFLPKENTGKTRQFVGKVRVFNAFHTKKMMTLNVQTEVFYCADKKTSVILYRFSPKEFGSAVWEKISAVKFRAGVCDF